MIGMQTTKRSYPLHPAGAVCPICGVSMEGKLLKAKFCSKVCSGTDYRRRHQTKPARQNKPTTVAREIPMANPRAKDKVANQPIAIGAPPLKKKTPTPIGKVAYGEVFPKTLLQRRTVNGFEVAPVYVGADTLPLFERLQRAFNDASAIKRYAVVVDGVLYPCLKDGWHIWKVSPEKAKEIRERYRSVS